MPTYANRRSAVNAPDIRSGGIKKEGGRGGVSGWVSASFDLVSTHDGDVGMKGGKKIICEGFGVWWKGGGHVLSLERTERLALSGRAKPRLDLAGHTTGAAFSNQTKRLAQHRCEL